jgi:hypothetical protein
MEGDANLLDKTLIVYGSPMGDGNVHNHRRCPLIVLGRRRQRAALRGQPAPQGARRHADGERDAQPAAQARGRHGELRRQHGRVPLMAPAAQGRAAAMRLLLAKGADHRLAGKTMDPMAASAQDRQARRPSAITVLQEAGEAGDGRNPTWQPDVHQVQAAVKAAAPARRLGADRGQRAAAAGRSRGGRRSRARRRRPGLHDAAGAAGRTHGAAGGARGTARRDRRAAGGRGRREPAERGRHIDAVAHGARSTASTTPRCAAGAWRQSEPRLRCRRGAAVLR